MIFAIVHRFMKTLRSVILCFAAFLFVVACFVPANAQNGEGGKYKLAVYATGLQNDKEISQSVKNIAQNSAMNALVNSGGYEMIERANEFLTKVAAEQKMQMSGDVRDDNIAKIGASYGAEKICVVSMTIIDKYLYVSARIVDVVTKTSTEAGEKDDENYTVAKINPTVNAAIAQILGTAAPASTGSRTPSNARATLGSDKEFTVNGVTFKMVFVKGGSMYLGCTAGSGTCMDIEKPSHNVTLSDYYMGETEITQALWKAVMGNNNNPSSRQGERVPVTNVNWNDCKEFVSKLNNKLSGQLPVGYIFALPSEAQWEYAARGGQKGSGSIYAGSNDINSVGWYPGNCEKETRGVHEVKGKSPNELRLYDMSGNVWGWCEDWFSSSFYSDNYNWTDPINSDMASDKVLRGGSYNRNVIACRVAFRGNSTPDLRSPNFGFRLSIVHQ